MQRKPRTLGRSDQFFPIIYLFNGIVAVFQQQWKRENIERSKRCTYISTYEYKSPTNKIKIALREVRNEIITNQCDTHEKMTDLPPPPLQQHKEVQIL